jgi:hypothetical protein
MLAAGAWISSFVSQDRKTPGTSRLSIEFCMAFKNRLMLSWLARFTYVWLASTILSKLKQSHNILIYFLAGRGVFKINVVSFLDQVVILITQEVYTRDYILENTWSRVQNWRL